MKNQLCCITRLKGGNIKIDVVPVQQQKIMGLIVAFMLSHSWYPLSTRKILQAYLLMKKSCEIIYLIGIGKGIVQNLSPLSNFVVAECPGPSKTYDQ